MKTFDELQVIFNEIENSFQNVKSYEKEIIDLNDYNRDKELDEDEYLKIIARLNNNKKRNDITHEKIETEKKIYNSKLNELVSSIEIDDVWLKLPFIVLKRKGSEIQVYHNIVNFHRANQGKAKVLPHIYKTLD